MELSEFFFAFVSIVATVVVVVNQRHETEALCCVLVLRMNFITVCCGNKSDCISSAIETMKNYVETGKRRDLCEKINLLCDCKSYINVQRYILSRRGGKTEKETIH